MSTILFANPPWWSVEHGHLRQGVRAGSRWPFTRPFPYLPDNFTFGAYCPYPFFLGSAAAYVAHNAASATVAMRDSVARGESYATFLDYVAALKPDAIVIETGAAAWDHDLQLLRHLKDSRPALRIAVAGPTAANASKTTPAGIVDAWLLGEYEKNSLAFVQGRNGIIPFNLLARDELSQLPPPMYDEKCAWNYWDACPVGTKPSEITIWASRGCAAVCNFCSFPAAMTNDDPLGKGGRKIRFYSAAWIETAIRDRMAAAQKAGITIGSIRFDGDTENASDRHTLEICEVMRKIGIPWSMMCRADTSSREVWQAMKDSGCFGVKIGFESGVDRIVNQVVKKNLDLKEAEATAKFLRSIGLSVHGTFMIGQPTETEEEKQMTIDFIRRLYRENGINSHQLSGSACLDGTPLANMVITDPNYVKDADGVYKLEGLLK